MSDFSALYDQAVAALQAPIAAYFDAMEGVDTSTPRGRIQATRAMAACSRGMQQALQSTLEDAARLAVGGDDISALRKQIAALYAEQNGFLGGFMDDLADMEKGQALTRASLYATAVLQAASELQIAFNDIELPYQPGCDDLDCAWHCKCHLEVTELDGAGNFDVQWVMEKEAEHCESCLELAAKWNPLKIRGGELTGDYELSNTKMAHVLHLLAGAQMMRL